MSISVLLQYRCNTVASIISCIHQPFLPTNIPSPFLDYLQAVSSMLRFLLNDPLFFFFIQIKIKLIFIRSLCAEKKHCSENSIACERKFSSVPSSPSVFIRNRPQHPNVAVCSSSSMFKIISQPCAYATFSAIGYNSESR